MGACPSEMFHRGRSFSSLNDDDDNWPVASIVIFDWPDYNNDEAQNLSTNYFSMFKLLLLALPDHLCIMLGCFQTLRIVLNNM